MSSEFIAIITFTIIFVNFLFVLPRILYMRYFQHSKSNFSYSYRGLLISYRWIHTITFVSCAISVVFLFTLISIILWSPRPLSSENILGGALTIIACLVWVYGSLVGFLNRTTVFVNSNGEITTTYGPLVVFRIPHRFISKVERIYYKPIMNIRVATAGLYSIWAENSLGHKILLFDRIDSESDAITIVNKVKQHLIDLDSIHIQANYPVRID